MRVAPQDVARVLIERRRADDDFAVGEAQGPLLGEGDGIAFRADLARIGLVDEQHARGVTAKVAGRFRRDDFQRAARRTCGA